MAGVTTEILSSDNRRMLDGFTDAINAGDTSVAGICADWLQDLELTLAEVLWLYRGTRLPDADMGTVYAGADGPTYIGTRIGPNPASYTGGLHQQALAEWLRRTEPEKEVSPSWMVPLPPGSLCKDRYRWGIVQLHGHTRHPSLKREILSLFPEVTRTVTADIPMDDLDGLGLDADRIREMSDRLESYGFACPGVRRDVVPLIRTQPNNLARTVTYTQVIPAPLWIPEEPLGKGEDMSSINTVLRQIRGATREPLYLEIDHVGDD
jgi:hypothetical protein